MRLLGAGGTGEVFEAMDGALGGAVALKALSPVVAGDAVERERFRREIQAARKITHANVCRIFDIGTQTVGGRERFFLTMELLVGDSWPNGSRAVRGSRPPRRCRSRRRSPQASTPRTRPASSTAI